MGEDPVSLAVTVGWLMSALTSLIAQLAALCCWLLASQFPAAPLLLFQQLSLFIGVLTGLVALLLLPIARRVRKVPPPASVIRVSLAISLTSLILPWLL